jgi:hypothetical protein
MKLQGTINKEDDVAQAIGLEFKTQILENKRWKMEMEKGKGYRKSHSVLSKRSLNYMIA